MRERTEEENNLFELYRKASDQLRRKEEKLPEYTTYREALKISIYARETFIDMSGYESYKFIQHLIIRHMDNKLEEAKKKLPEWELYKQASKAITEFEKNRLKKRREEKKNEYND